MPDDAFDVDLSAFDYPVYRKLILSSPWGVVDDLWRLTYLQDDIKRLAGIPVLCMSISTRDTGYALQAYSPDSIESLKSESEIQSYYPREFKVSCYEGLEPGAPMSAYLPFIKKFNHEGLWIQNVTCDFETLVQFFRPNTISVMLDCKVEPVPMFRDFLPVLASVKSLNYNIPGSVIKTSDIRSLVELNRQSYVIMTLYNVDNDIDLNCIVELRNTHPNNSVSIFFAGPSTTELRKKVHAVVRKHRISFYSPLVYFGDRVDFANMF